MKPFLLYTTPRSGGTAVYYLLQAAFEAIAPVKDLCEFFCLQYDWEDSPHGIKWMGQTDQFVYSDAEIKNRTFNKWELLKKYKDQYSLKVHASQIIGTQMQWWLEDNYEWIFLERKNTFEQLLSFIVSAETHMWYDPRLKLIPHGSLQAQKKTFLSFFWREKLPYEKVKAFIKPKKVLFYEDFLSQNPKDFLLPLHLNWQKAEWKNKVEKQNVANKLDLFINKDEILNWWNEWSLTKSKEQYAEQFTEI